MQLSAVGTASHFAWSQLRQCHCMQSDSNLVWLLPCTAIQRLQNRILIHNKFTLESCLMDCQQCKFEHFFSLTFTGCWWSGASTSRLLFQLSKPGLLTSQHIWQRLLLTVNHCVHFNRRLNIFYRLRVSRALQVALTMWYSLPLEIQQPSTARIFCNKRKTVSLTSPWLSMSMQPCL